jgi:HAD superfamily hydrolase (TIGR01490 family)
MASRTAAFFDLDGTLLLKNSGALWLKSERRAGRVSAWQALWGGIYLVGYRLAAIDMDEVMEKALATIRGESEAVIRERTHTWYHHTVAPLAAPGAWPVLAEHRAQGHPLVLLTSSSRYESEAAQAQFALDDILYTGYAVEDGRFTGQPVRPLCYGAGKVTWAERWAEAHDVDLAASFFYTDSLTDVPMLERVGQARVVNPDARLRRFARKRGWPVLDWRFAPEATA